MALRRHAGPAICVCEGTSRHRAVAGALRDVTHCARRLSRPPYVWVSCKAPTSVCGAGALHGSRASFSARIGDFSAAAACRVGLSIRPYSRGCDQVKRCKRSPRRAVHSNNFGSVGFWMKRLTISMSILSSGAAVELARRECCS